MSQTKKSSKKEVKVAKKEANKQKSKKSARETEKEKKKINPKQSKKTQSSAVEKELPNQTLAKATSLFHVDDYIVYPTQGVGKIIAIEDVEIENQKKPYYVIEIMEKKLKIKIPLDSIDKASIRPIINKNEVKKVLKILEEEPEQFEEDWKVRYQNNLAKIKSGSIFEIAKVCRNLYKRARDKELSLMERRLYETAYNLVTWEIALAKGIGLEESKNLVSEILSKEV